MAANENEARTSHRLLIGWAVGESALTGVTVTESSLLSALCSVPAVRSLELLPLFYCGFIVVIRCLLLMYYYNNVSSQ